jgi:hypothetical protein
LPQSEKHARFDPRLKPIMRRRIGTSVRLIERVPLAPRSQEIEDGVSTRAGSTRAVVRHQSDGY